MSHILSLIFHFTELSVADIHHAAGMRWKNYEDAVQSATAERLHAAYIVTRNVKDFKAGRIPALTPSELLARLSDRGGFDLPFHTT